jgi:hypothetical protein
MACNRSLEGTVDNAKRGTAGDEQGICPKWMHPAFFLIASQYWWEEIVERQRRGKSLQMQLAGQGARFLLIWLADR